MTDIYRMSEDDRRKHAMAAAHSATEAATELLRFAREGASHDGTFGDVEVVEKLLDAAKMAIECLSDDDDGEAHRFTDIYGDLRHELAGWI